MYIFFLGGLFLENDYRNIIENSKGSVQNAADVLQKKYLDGFSNSLVVKEIKVINLPYIGSYPLYYKVLNYHGDKFFDDSNKIKINNICFCNLMVYKNIIRFFKSFIHSFKILKKYNSVSEEKLFFTYAMHLPFLLSIFILKKF